MEKKEKFSFDINFQWSILKFTLTDKNGYKALSLYNPEYFDLNEQQVIAEAIKRFFKRWGRIPQNIGLIEEIRHVFKGKKYINNFTSVDKANVVKKAKSLYKGIVKDSDVIIEGCIQFAAYTQLKKVIEDADITDFNQYPTLSKKIQTAINTGVDIKEEKGTFVVSGVMNRQARRKLHNNVFPTPFIQINNMTNGGGYTKGSVLVLMDKGKGGKTKVLINVARGYLRRRKKILYIDLENGEDAIAIRMDQSILRKEKKEILSEQYDEKLQKIYRKYKRLGGEVVIKRLPALVTKASDIKNLRDKLKNDDGITFDVCIIDYIAAMGCEDGDKDDNGRISKAYVECKNLAEESGWECIWTGHHTNRDAQKRRPYKYEPNDTAKCIDVHRHVDAMFGVNQNDIEEQNGIIRLEVIDQRDGVSDGRAFFWDDFSIQRIDELTKSEVKNLLENKKKLDDGVKKPERKTDLDKDIVTE